MLKMKLTASLLLGAALIIANTSAASAQGYNPADPYAAQQQANYNYAAAQDAWATHTVPGMYPGGYNDGTKSYNFNGSITPNGYGLTPSGNGDGRPPTGFGYGAGYGSGYGNGYGNGYSNVYGNMGNTTDFRYRTEYSRRRH